MHTTPETAGIREWLGLAVLALPTLLVSIDVSVIILALPHIGQALDADSTQQLWIMDIYGFLLAGFMVTMGTLGDRVGRRKMLMVGGTGFAAASVLAAFAPTAEMLILARALLGIAGATISPSIMALITNMFRNEAQRGFAISVWLVAFMGGMTIGPLVGGLVLEQFWWGAAFLLGVPVMILTLVAAPVLLPEYKDSHAGRIDLTSVGLSLLTILPFVYGLKEIAKHGVEPFTLAAVAIGLGFGFLFVRRQQTLKDPLLDLRLFANPMFSGAVGGMFLIAGTGASMLYVNQYLQLVLGFSPLVSGLWSLPGAAASVIGLLYAPKIAAKVKPSLLIGGGLVISAAGMFLLTTVGTVGGLAALVAGFVLSNLGCAPMVTLASGIVMGSVKPEKAGSAAAIQETCGELGFALGIAVLGSLGTMLYRGAIGPVDVPEAARDSLAGAVGTAATLSPEAAASLLAVARDAWMRSFQIVVVIAGVMVFGVAALAFRLFRSVPALDQPPAEPEAVMAPAE
jgi:DHA2 family multidrug resistance protein-like MFS transporter